MKSKKLIPIGSKIEIDKSKIKTDLDKRFINNLPQRIDGTIIDYKMTDGGGVGVVVRFNDGTKRWFFEDEFARG